MPATEPRSHAIQRDFERGLSPFLQTEAASILARVMASVVARDPKQFSEVTGVFRDSFSSEYDYQTRRHALKRMQGVS
jgi:hypothetical protein